MTCLALKIVMVGQIYPSELQLNNANLLNIEAPFLDLALSITKGYMKFGFKIYDQSGYFNSKILKISYRASHLWCIRGALAWSFISVTDLQTLSCLVSF